MASYSDRRVVSMVPTYPAHTYSAGPQRVVHDPSRTVSYAAAYGPAAPHGTVNEALYFLRIRAKALCVAAAALALLTFVSFWAVFYWPILLAFLMLYLSFVCYRVVAYSGSGVSGYGSGLLAGKELVFIVFAIAMLMSLAEAILGVILVILEDDGTRLAFQAISAATGVLSLFVLFLLNATLRYLDGPVVVSGARGSGGTVSFGMHAGPSAAGCYEQHYYPQPRPSAPTSSGSMSFHGRHADDGYANGPSQRTSPSRRPSPRRVAFAPYDDDGDDDGSNRAPAYMPSPQRRAPSPTSVIPPAGLAEMRGQSRGGSPLRQAYRGGSPVREIDRSHAPFGSPSPRLPYPLPAQYVGSSGTRLGDSIYAERSY